LVFEHDERRTLRPIQEISLNTDDMDTATVSKTFRVDGNLNPSGSDGRGRIGRNVAIRAPT
jgi:hypothetical protein